MSPIRSSPTSSVLDELLRERPSLHGTDSQPVSNWQLGDRLLHWLDRNVPEGATTLETGCGYSTLLFAARSGAHTVVSPIEAEHRRVREWCAAHGVAVDHVRFACEPSERWLPAAAADGSLGVDLDVVLIDGSHSYPGPAVDYQYLGPVVAVGGLLIVDDISIRACGDLADFLAAERGRWQRVTTVSDAAVFRKLAADAADFRPWNQQPWNRRRAVLRDAAGRVRSVVRLRSRLRAIRTGGSSA